MADATSGIGDKVKASWAAVKPNLVTWIIAGLIAGFLSCFLLIGNMMAGLTIMVIKSKNGEKIEIGDLFKGFDRFVDHFVCGLLVFIPIIGGFLVPWAVFYCVDKKADFMTSIKWSIAYFLKNLVPCLIAFIVAFVLNFVGMIACCVGQLVTQPVSLVFLFDHYKATEATTAAGEAPAAPKV